MDLGLAWLPYSFSRRTFQDDAKTLPFLHFLFPDHDQHMLNAQNTNTKLIIRSTLFYNIKM